MDLWTFDVDTSSFEASDSIDVVTQAFGHLINAEHEFVGIYKALEDARGRGRHDLIEG